MNPIKLNLNPFAGVSGAQQIQPMEIEAPKPASEQEEQTPALSMEGAPDIEGVVDIQDTNLNFDDKLKKGFNQ